MVAADLTEPGLIEAVSRGLEKLQASIPKMVTDTGCFIPIPSASFKADIQVDDDGYFLTVIKYVHRNPVKAGVCERCEDYAFSSAREYWGMCKSSLVQTELFGGIMKGNDIRAFFNTPSDEKCIDVSETHRMNDAEARAVMKRICRCDQPGAFQKLPIDKQAKAIERMREQLSIRQISRITGVSTEIVRKYKVKET